MKTKYHALRVISFIYKGLAVVVFAGTLLLVGLLLLFTVADGSSNFIDDISLASFLPFVVSAIVAVSLYATGELLDLLIDMEANARASRILLTRMAQWEASGVAPGAAGGGPRRSPVPPSQLPSADEFMPDIGEF